MNGNASFGRSSVLGDGVPQLKPRILRGNTTAPSKILLHTSTYILHPRENLSTLYPQLL